MISAIFGADEPEMSRMVMTTWVIIGRPCGHGRRVDRKLVAVRLESALCLTV